jgi:hypothetical protein
MALLQKFLGHVAIHVEEVFSSDPGGCMVLPSCLLSCKFGLGGYLGDGLVCVTNFRFLVTNLQVSRSVSVAVAFMRGWHHDSTRV